MKTYTLRPNISLPKIYLYRKPVDFRKGHRGLGAIIEQELAHDPFSGTLYAFINRICCKRRNSKPTTCKVMKEPGMEATGHKWIWVMRGGPPKKPVISFDYDKSRGKAVAKRLLEYSEGTYFQSDGYPGYDQACLDKGIVHLGCWDHARRKFVEAEKGQPKQKHKKAPPSKATVALSLINKLYRIEREIKTLDSDEKYEQRQKRYCRGI